MKGWWPDFRTVGKDSSSDIATFALSCWDNSMKSYRTITIWFYHKNLWMFTSSLIEYWSNWVEKSELWYAKYFQRTEKSLRDLYLQCWLNISSISLYWSNMKELGVIWKHYLKTICTSTIKIVINPNENDWG